MAGEALRATSEFAVVTGTGTIRGRISRPVGDRVGAPVVFIHPANGTGLQWDDLWQLLPPDREYVIPDLRGHGASVPHGGPFGVEDHVQDICDLVHDLELASVHLIGASVGGAIACGVADAQPEEVLSITAVGSGVVGPTGDSEAVPEMIRELGADGMLKRILPACFPEGTDPDLIHRAWLTSNKDGDPKVVEEVWRGVLGMDARQWADGVGCASLVVNGSEDSTFDPDAGREFAELMGGQFVKLEGAGHLPMMDAPHELARVILDSGVLDES